MRKLPLYLCMVLISPWTWAQSDFQKIIPPSPTMSALGKYGELPVGTYTGAPNISIPISIVKIGSFELPITVSYHASGMKVEEVASWVGLGWSLNAGGVITRATRGLVDEEGNGFLSGALDVTQFESLSDSEKADYGFQLAQGNLDGEADIFYYNFGKYSGKFFYSQEEQNFVSIPRENLVFDKSYFITNRKWRVVAEDGTQYYFDLFEENLTFTDCNGSASPATPMKTGWFLTKVITGIGSREINFNYEPVSYANKNITSRTLNTTTAGPLRCGVQPNVICNSVNNYSGYRLSQITYPSGRTEFKALTDRCDLLGDKRLDMIELYRESETTPYKKFNFAYSYFNNGLLPISGCGSEEVSYKVRLKLISIQEESSDSIKLSPHQFVYNETLPLPSRFSYAQDVWGFYNGAEQNTTLVPSYKLFNGNSLVEGADRRVDTTKTALGVLQKVIYPTGGSTSFYYENHKVPGFKEFSTSPYLSSHIQQVSISDRCLGAGSQPIFCKTFTINDQRGTGTYVKIRVVDVNECQHCPVAQSCADLSLSKGDYGFTITCDADNVFVPNGTYTLKADFTTHPNPSAYQEFAIVVSWEEYNPPPGAVQNCSVGGLRLKKMVDNDGSQDVRTRFFMYNYDNNLSSGYLTTERFVFEYNQPCYDPTGGGVTSDTRVRTAYSNVPINPTQGSIVGYKMVTVLNNENGDNGKSIFYYSSPDDFPDVVNNDFPFSPPISFEHRRGLLLKQEEYRRDGNQYYLVKQTETTYKPLDLIYDWEDPVIVNSDPLFKVSLGIKAGFYKKWEDSGIRPSDAFPPKIFKTITEWVRPVKITERKYDLQGNYQQREIFNEYKNPDHMQITKTTSIESSGDTIRVYNKYPLDYSATSGSLYNLKQKHVVGSVIETYRTQKIGTQAEEVVDAVYNVYEPTLPVPREVMKLEIKEPQPLADDEFIPSTTDVNGTVVKDAKYKTQLQFTYDVQGNLLVQQNRAAMHAYLWGYNAMYPIAEILNAKADESYHSSFEDNGVVFITNGTNSAKTGKKVWDSGSYSIPGSFDPINLAQLRISYWYWQNNTWNFSGVLPFTRDIVSTGTKLDEIRVFPPDAKMTTYTYDVGVGITTATNHDNNTTYYSYDGFGRLETVRDQSGDLIQLFKYNIKSN